MHTEPVIRPNIRRQFERACISPVESRIVIKTFDPQVDSRRPLDAVLKESTEVLAFCRAHGISPATGQRRVGRSNVHVVNQIDISLDQACLILDGHPDGNSEALLHEARRRRESIAFFELDDEKHTQFAKNTRTMEPEVFDGIVMIAHYIREHPGLNIHQRTVSLPGIDTKFVERHRLKIEMLLDEGEFQLKDHRSVEIIVCYRDPEHMATSQRLCDIIIPGYSDTPFEYVPKSIVVCENKHSAMFLPPRAGMITMMGVGHSAASRILTELRISHHPHLVYWGDIDIEGLAILANVRKAGLKVTSICMDKKTAQRFKSYDVLPQHHSNITVNPLFLTTEERSALKMIEGGAIHRIEQEKLPEDYVNHQLDLVLGSKKN